MTCGEWKGRPWAGLGQAASPSPSPRVERSPGWESGKQKAQEPKKARHLNSLLLVGVVINSDSRCCSVSSSYNKWAAVAGRNKGIVVVLDPFVDHNPVELDARVQPD